MSPFAIILYALSVACFITVPLMIYQRDEKIDRWIMGGAGMIFFVCAITAHALIPHNAST